jgi:hypothetical protein
MKDPSGMMIRGLSGTFVLRSKILQRGIRIRGSIGIMIKGPSGIRIKDPSGMMVRGLSGTFVLWSKVQVVLGSKIQVL